LTTSREAAQALKGGGLVILPTETVYGLAADAANAAAVAAIFEAKGRPRFNPLIAHVDSALAAQRIAVLDDRAQALTAAFWPGPLTIVAPFRDGVCDLARAGLDTVAVRVPGHALAREVLTALGGPVVAPSANRSGRPSPTTYADAMEETGFAAAASLDGGPCAVGLESTVVACLPGEPVALLRPGSVTRQEIEAIVGALAEGPAHAGRSPGRMALHYAPDAPVRLNAIDIRDGEVRIGFGPGEATFNLSPSGDLKEAAANLFALLRAADRLKPVGIAIAPVPSEGLGEAINDRLIRAAGHIG
jgi:L-threonylcarbamoyladenylate synthase